MMTRTFVFVPVLFVAVFAIGKLFPFAGSPSGDVVIQWNLVTIKSAKAAKQNSNLATHTAAIEAIAVYDAVNSIKHFGAPYHSQGNAGGPASEVAAVAQ